MAPLGVFKIFLANYVILTISKGGQNNMLTNIKIIYIYYKPKHVQPVKWQMYIMAIEIKRYQSVTSKQNVTDVNVKSIYNFPFFFCFPIFKQIGIRLCGITLIEKFTCSEVN